MNGRSERPGVESHPGPDELADSHERDGRAAPEASRDRRAEEVWERIARGQNSAPGELGRRAQTGLRLLTTAALAAACAVLSVLLWQARQEVQPPVPGFPTTLTPAASSEPPPSSHRRPALRIPLDRKTVLRPPRGHRLDLTLELPADMPAETARTAGLRFVAEILPPPGEGPGEVRPVNVISSGAVQVAIDPDPAPGQYGVNLFRFEKQDLEWVAWYTFRVGLPEDAAGG